MGKKGGRVFKNNYKGHMDKTKGRQNQGRDVGMAGVGGRGGGKRQTTVLEQQQNFKNGKNHNPIYVFKILQYPVMIYQLLQKYKGNPPEKNVNKLNI